jgi:methionyl-tRNA synthetase
METINFEQYTEIASKLEITLGKILSVERVPKSNKMLKLTVEFKEGSTGTVMTNIGDKVNPEDLESCIYPFITNLAPVKIMGIESIAMIMVPTIDGEIDIKGNTGSRLM